MKKFNLLLAIILLAVLNACQNDINTNTSNENYNQTVKPSPETDWCETFVDRDPSSLLLDFMDSTVTVRTDNDGQYFFAENSNRRTVSFKSAKFIKEVSRNLVVGYVQSPPSLKKWIVFDRNLNQCDTLELKMAYQGFALSPAGVYDADMGKLRFRTFAELFGWYKIPVKYDEMELEVKKGKIYLANRTDGKKVLLN